MKTRVVYRGSFLTVQVEEVELPNGERIALDVVRHPGACAVVPFVSRDEVLLLRQYRHAAGGYLWEVPAGKLDGEDPETCARRELEEEAGQRAGRLLHHASILVSPGFTDEVIHLFSAHELTPVPQRLDPDEVIEIVRRPLAEALDMVWRGELRDAKSALALVHAARHIGALA